MEAMDTEDFNNSPISEGTFEKPGKCDIAKLTGTCTSKELITKSVITNGCWSEKPHERAKCIVQFFEITPHGLSKEQLGTYLNNTECSSVEVIIGEGDTVVDRLIDRCLQSMLVEEISSVVMYVPKQNGVFYIGSLLEYSGIISFKIKLIEVINETLFVDWPVENKYQVALHHKEKGVELFRHKRIEDAFLRFSKSFKYIISMHSLADVDLSLVKKIEELHVIVLNNMASCQLIMCNYNYAMDLTQKALEIDPINIKALYKHASSALENHLYEEAENSLIKLTEIAPNNQAVKLKMQEFKERTKEMNLRYNTIVKKMFQ